jgi:hypothetical protein
VKEIISYLLVWCQKLQMKLNYVKFSGILYIILQLFLHYLVTAAAASSEVLCA